MASNTRLDASFVQTAKVAQLSADKQIAARVKATEATAASTVALQAKIASLPAGSKEQIAAQAVLNEQLAKQSRLLGVSTIATTRYGGSVKTAERDLNKMVRGVASGSGVLGRFSRSLAFASTGFIAFATAAVVIKESIVHAENLAKAQRSLDVAIRHTGGDVRELQPRYEAVAKAAAQFGINQVEATTGLARATVLTGNAAAAQRAYQEALVISKATGKEFNVALTATSKAQEGITTSLRRYGILVTPTMKGTEQFALVMKRFGGQAAANTTASERLSASFANLETSVGEALLPTFEKLVNGLTKWFTKMTETGRLQRDVTTTIDALGDVLKALVLPIRVLDKITGSFGNTLKLLIGLRVGTLLIGKWIPALQLLAASWMNVAKAATSAGAAQGLLGAGSIRGAAGTAAVVGTAGVARSSRVTLVGGGKDLTFASKAGELTRAESQAAAKFPAAKAAFVGMGTALGGLAPIAAAVVALQIVESKTYKDLREKLIKAAGGNRSFLGQTIESLTMPLTQVPGKAFQATKDMVDAWGHVLGLMHDKSANIAKQMRELAERLGASRSIEDIFGPPPSNIFGNAQPMKQFWQKFELTFRQQLAQAQASLTRSTADDVANARQIVARIKRLLDEGRLHGQALIQALGLEASALSTIWSAEDAAAQRRAQRAQAAKERIQKQIEAAMDPVRLELALARAQLAGSTPAVIRALKALRDNARKMLESGKLSFQQQITEIQQIISLNQQIKDAAQTTTANFQLSAKLQLALARDEALGLDPTKDLLKAKRALEKFIAKHKKNWAALTDAYHQLAAINEQLGSSVQSVFGTFKQASTRALTAGLGLTPEQRRALRARLSQLGPGGTVPGEGTGAAGFIIGPNGRPIQVRGGGPTISGRDSQVVTASRFNRLLRVLERTADRPLHVVVDLDGKIIADNTTRHQQRRHRHNSSQRRGPNAATA